MQLRFSLLTGGFFTEYGEKQTLNKDGQISTQELQAMQQQQQANRGKGRGQGKGKGAGNRN